MYDILDFVKKFRWYRPGRNNCLMSMQQDQSQLAFIIVTHGNIGEAMLAVAEYILGRKLENFVAVKIPFMGELPNLVGSSTPFPFAERRKLIKEEMRKAKKRVDQGQGVIVLADLFGGTGFNVANELLDAQNELIIAGVNLPMILKAAETEHGSPLEVSKELVDRSRGAIVCRQIVSSRD